MNISTYASGYSAFNCIEHLWSPLSKKLAGAVFPNTLQGESKPPIHQGGLTKDQCAEREKQIFDRAMENIENGYWSNRTFNNSNVIVQTVSCNEDDLIFQAMIK